MFNNLSYWLFLVFGFTNLIAGAWTYFYCPETGGRSFEENQVFFDEAKKAGTWRVDKIKNGEYTKMPASAVQDESGERQPLLRRVADQAT